MPKYFTETGDGSAGNGGDGFTAVGTNNTWPNFRSVSLGAKTFDNTSTTSTIQARGIGTDTYAIAQTFLEFETAIDDAVSIELYLYCESISSDGATISVLEGEWTGQPVDSGTNLTNRCNYADPWTAETSISVGANIISLNASAVSYINANSTFRIMIVEHHMMSDSTPPATGDDHNATFSMADHGTASRRPYIEAKSLKSGIIRIPVDFGKITLSSGKITF